jgi:hypothetical protein
MRDAVRTLSTGGAEDSAHAGVPQGLVDVGKPILIAAGQKMAISVENMSATFDLQTPAFQNPGAAIDPLSIGCTRWRHEPHPIAWP